MERVVILGSGMAGWGAAHRLNEEGVPPIQQPILRIGWNNPDIRL